MIDDERTINYINRIYSSESEEIFQTVQKLKESGDIFVDEEGMVNVSSFFIKTIVPMMNSKHIKHDTCR
jgi:hypothetical protein